MNTPDAFENLLANLRPAPLPQSLIEKAQRVAQIMAAQAPMVANPADALQAVRIAHEMGRQPPWLSALQNPGPAVAQPTPPALQSPGPIHVMGPMVGQMQELPGAITMGMLPMSATPPMLGVFGSQDVAVPMVNADGVVVFGLPPVSRANAPSTSYALVRGWSFVEGPALPFMGAPDGIDPLIFFELGGPRLDASAGDRLCPQPCGCLLAYYVTGPFKDGCTPPKPYWIVDIIYERCAERWFVSEAKWAGVKKSNKKIIVSENPLVWIFEFEDGPVQVGDCDVAVQPGGAPGGTAPSLLLGAGFLIWAPGCDPYYQEQIVQSNQVWDLCPENGKTPISPTRTDPKDGSFVPDSKTGADPGGISQPGKKVDGSGDTPGLVTPLGVESNAMYGEQKVQKYTLSVETKTFMWCGPQKTLLGVYEQTSFSEVTYDCGQPNKSTGQDARSSRKSYTSAKELNDPKNKTKKQGLDRKLGGAYPGSSIDGGPK